MQIWLHLDVRGKSPFMPSRRYANDIRTSNPKPSPQEPGLSDLHISHSCELSLSWRTQKSVPKKQFGKNQQSKDMRGTHHEPIVVRPSEEARP